MTNFGEYTPTLTFRWQYKRRWFARKTLQQKWEATVSRESYILTFSQWRDVPTNKEKWE